MGHYGPLSFPLTKLQSSSMKKLTLLFSLLILSSKGFAATDSVECLAKNMYHEARGESIRGLIAVAHVTLNRTMSEEYPARVCDVVYQKNQFSWTATKSRIKDYTRYEEIREIAYNVLHGQTDDPTRGALNFHKVGTKTSWKLKPKARIGNHIFY